MPANLTPEFIKAREQFSRARTTEEKVEALKLMLATIPKHKGTDHMVGDIKRRLAEQRKEVQREKKRGKRGISYRVPPEGAGQVVLIGTPNVGKSSILAALTNAKPQIGDYPFTTRVPMPGMMHYEDIQIQLVDTPPITAEFMEPWMTEVVSPADAALLVCDLSSDEVLEAIEGVRIRLGRSKIRLVGKAPEQPDEENAFPMRRIKTVLLGNKGELPGAEEHFAALQELYGEQFELFRVSAKTGDGLEELRELLFRFLRIIRIYTKQPGKKADLEQPFALHEGDTVLRLAEMVHKDFLETLKYARVWGSNVFDGQQVKRDHVLQDKDVVELHV